MSQLDEKVVPRLARGLARARSRVPRRGGRVGLLVGLTGAAAIIVGVVLTRPEPPPAGGTSPAWVGVHEGDHVPAYLELAAARLAALGADEPDRVVYALVSLGRYLTPDEVAALVAGAPGVTSVAAHARVPLAGRQTQLVRLPAIRLPEDLVSSMAETADRKEADAEHYAALVEQEPEGALRDIYRSNAEVARAEAQAYRQECGCVFGLVVRGDATALTRLAGEPDVRAVDPAPEVRDPRDAVFAPLLPEHLDRVSPPADGALPTRAPTTLHDQTS